MTWKVLGGDFNDQLEYNDHLKKIRVNKNDILFDKNQKKHKKYILLSLNTIYEFRKHFDWRFQWPISTILLSNWKIKEI